jgi:hypothetical protein
LLVVLKQLLLPQVLIAPGIRSEPVDDREIVDVAVTESGDESPRLAA